MAIPEHYSREIIARCQNLIDRLSPVVERGLGDEGRFGGPLRTTFLLAMATPMMTLPIERIFKPANRTTAADDRVIDAQLTGAVAEALADGRTFGGAPFAGTSRWSYVYNCAPFNIAKYWPDSVLDALKTPEAFAAAKDAAASRILLDLRNALAHGGVAYLDKNGRQTDGSAEMFGFASTRTKDGKIVGLNILRITEIDFRAFLAAWANWINKSAVATSLNEENYIA